MLKDNLFSDDSRNIFLERLLLLEEAEEEFRLLPKELKYANAFAYLLQNITVNINPGELIVGGVDEILPSKEQEELYVKKAKEKNFNSLELFTFDPLGLIEIKDTGIKYAPDWFNSWGHLTVSWDDLLCKGYLGIKNDAQLRLSLPSNSSDRKKYFLQSVIIVCDAMVSFAYRYAKKAYELSQSEKDETRARELRQISEVCRQVPAHAAQTFRQALQSVWFTNLVLHCICGARDYGLGRMDQYLYPYFKNEMNNGNLSRSAAAELLACFFIKMNEIIGYGVETHNIKRILSVNSLQYAILGGSDCNGNDVTNELSALILNVVGELELKQPTLVIRYHRKINRAFLEDAVTLLIKGHGYPSFYNDHVVIPALVNMGVPVMDAINYVHYGCNNPNIPGKEDELREGWHCLPKYLELALNQGHCMLTGNVLGAKTASLSEIPDFTALLNEFAMQIRYGVRRGLEKVQQGDAYWRELKPFSFESVLLKHCIEQAEDCTGEGVASKHMNNHAVGLATVVNSLAAIKKLVFDEGRLSLEELCTVLVNNFKNDDFLRREIQHKLPKFGNEQAYVDDIAAKTGEIYCKTVMEVSEESQYPRRLWPSFYSLWHHREMGKYTAASADGRLAGEPLSESQSPVYGTEQFGPTAALNSLLRLPFQYTPGGGINFKLQPNLLRGEQGILLLLSLIEGYFSKGGLQLQINVLDRELLVDAMNNPEKYPNLLVRVVGYSAYFITLAPEQQEEILQRSVF